MKKVTIVIRKALQKRNGARYLYFKFATMEAARYFVHKFNLEDKLVDIL